MAFLYGRGRHGKSRSLDLVKLHEAVEYDHPETIKLLILAGADSSAQNNFGDTPQVIANGKYGPIRILPIS